ncbi:MAG: hypothetical protein NVV68_18560 [Dokdonella sp.]|nr:hypothetical protein [Dokdonella sp.]
MPPISDEDLILYYYDDGLDPAERAAIAGALSGSPELRARLAALETMLAAVDAAPVAPPDPGLRDRLWRRLEPQLRAEAAPARHPPRAARRTHSTARPRRLAAWSAAALLALAVGVGFIAGRHSAPEVDAQAQARADAAALRVLEAYVAAHLRSTEGVLLTADNGGEAGMLDGNRALAASLVESNRLYARAAERAGDASLADFLRRLEPVLLSLANQTPAATVESDEGLRDYLRETDLLFQVRALQTRLDHARVQRL